MLRQLLLICLILSLAASASAQFRDSLKEKKSQDVADTSHFHMQRSPTVALLLSGVLPGAGQIYTGCWYKTPFIVAGIVGCFVGASIQNGRYLADIDSVNNQLARGDTYNASRYTAQREFYRDDRDKFYIYAGLVYIANLLDAYISAHLFDFDVSDPESSAFLEAPHSRDEPWRMAIRLRF
ncbi:MAG: DUF5683 domain-containing protein [Ignavibacteriota bacterium]